MSTIASRRVPVTVRADGSAVVLELADRLDADTGEALVAESGAAGYVTKSELGPVSMVEAWVEAVG